MGRRLSESLEQGLVMAPPRARMTNDRSTGIAVKGNWLALARVGDCYQMSLMVASNANCSVKQKVTM